MMSLGSNQVMYMNWRELIKPKRVEVTTANKSYGKFVCEPLERGFGTTIGNAIRRILLSSIHGAAIVSAKIDGVMQEFAAIPGMLEDVSELLLNLKEVRLQMSDPEARVIRIEASKGGQGGRHHNRRRRPDTEPGAPYCNAIQRC